MADISDVMNGVANTVNSWLYPNGAAQPSITSLTTMIYPGWPTPAQLDKDLKAGKVHVSVYALPTERQESIINQDAQTSSIAAPGVTITISGLQVIIGGTPKVGDVACLSVNRHPQNYAVQSGDTTSTIATTLAALVGGTASGPVITLASTAFLITSTVSTLGAVLLPKRRIARHIQVTTWASTPTSRDATGKAVDDALWNSERIQMPDGSNCGVIYVSSPISDKSQKTKLYRRDLIIQARFMETISSTAQTVADMTANITTPAAVQQVQFNIGA